MSRPPIVGLVCCAAGILPEVRPLFVEPALARGWQLGVTLTPTAARWLDAAGETERIATLTGLPVRSASRLPTEPRPHPDPDCWVVAPATANTVAELALGLAANQALTQLCEALGAGEVPIVVAPRVSTANTGHPAWAGHVAALRAAGAQVLLGDPGAAGPAYSWPTILTTTAALLDRRSDLPAGES
jgi:hypothetical protein